MGPHNPFYQIIRKKQPGQADSFFLYITTYLNSSNYEADGYEILSFSKEGALFINVRVSRSGIPLNIIKTITHQIELEDIDIDDIQEISIQVIEQNTVLLASSFFLHDETETVVKPANLDIEGVSHHSGDARLDMIPVIESEASQYITKTVFFGTNRKSTDNSNPEDRYSRERTDKDNTEYGTCQVSIPKDHITGNIERPSWWKSLFSEISPEKHMTILSLTNQEEEAFLQKLKDSFSIEYPGEKQILLFVHGYNVDFEESVLRTAQLAYDLGFPGPALTYSWPSRGKLLGYMADEASVSASVKYFKQFLTALIQKSGASKLHIIAHSMGNRLVVDTLEKLAAEKVAFQSIIRHVVLAAPDIDASVFKQQVVPAFKGVNRVTLYASSEDKALQISMSMRAQYPRAGQSGSNICLIKGVDTIDASKVGTTWLGHGYFADTKALIDDIHMLITNDIPPTRRNLREIMSSPVPHWTFPRTE